jgi:hypothetical protein
MGYLEIKKMADSSRLRDRLNACAAEQITDPNIEIENWVGQRLWHIVSAPGWGDKWASAEVSDPGNDLGGRTDVITDGDILAVIQPMVA